MVPDMSVVRYPQCSSRLNEIFAAATHLLGRSPVLSWCVVLCATQTLVFNFFSQLLELDFIYFIYSKHVARHMASLPYACRNISKVSAPDLPSLTQNLILARCSIFTYMLKWQMWRHTWSQTLVLCNYQCWHSEATLQTKWRRCQLSIVAYTFTWCHRLAVCVK